MNNFLIIDEHDMDYIWDVVQNQQIIFHPEIAPYGKFDYKKFFEIKRMKPFILFVDRNILSGLIKFCEQGNLQDKGESQLLGIIMTWAIMNDISISAGPAIQEGATQIKNQEQALKELQKFLDAFDAYPGQTWLNIAKGQEMEVPPIKLSYVPAKNISVGYANGCDHYYMTVASMLHTVGFYRNHNMKPVDKIIEFMKWTYDNLLVSQYVLVYVTLLLANQEKIKAPKGANSNQISRIMAGCENQAWDLTYLSNWSTLYGNTENYAEEFLFATNDILLKRIFVNTHGPNGINGLFFEVFSKKDYNKLCDFIEDQMENRIKPDFGTNPRKYFQRLIEKEKGQIVRIIENK
jgi:hypothetical protein